jgi:predicted nucleotidyltransferase
MEVFYMNPEREFSLSDLAKEARVSKPHVAPILDKLLRAGFLQITKLSNIWRIRADRQSLFFIRNKILFNLNFVYQSGIVEYLNEKYQNPKAILLFGSIRTGEDISSSDIDLAIELDSGEYKTERLTELKNFETQIGRKIQIHLFSREDIDINVFNSIANGILLSGFLEVKP